MTTNLLMSPQGSAAGGDGTMTIVMFVLMAVVFYFFMIRPQLKKQKEQKEFRDALAVGSNVVTIGGIHGKITAISDTTVVLKVEGGTTLKIEKSAIVSDFEKHQQQKR